MIELLFLVVTAALCGINQWKYIELFGKAQLGWYRKYFAFENGIPSNVTLGRVFAAIDNKSFNELFMRWVKSSNMFENSQQVAIDGKRLRGSYDNSSDQPAHHVVSAFAAQAGLCITQISCGTKSNEITAIPHILDQINKGAIITIDAIACQKNIVEKIITNKSEYIIAVKQNQEELFEQAKKMFTINQPSSINTTVDIGHGRIETRKCTVVSNLKFMDVACDWKGLKTVIKIETERIIKLTGQCETNTRYYISSMDINAEKLNKFIRSHWAIENNLHWVLDVIFKEDKSRRRKGDSPLNFSIIAKIAMTLIKKAKIKKLSYNAIMAKASWSTDFRETLLRFK